MSLKSKIILSTVILALIGVLLIISNNNNIAGDYKVSDQQNLDTDYDNNTGNDNHDSDTPETQDEKHNTSPIQITISSLDQTSNEISIRTVLDGIESGECKIMFSKTGYKEIVRTANISLVTSYYTCQGWDISKSLFPSKGMWNISIEAVNSEIKGQSETRSINIE
jgi:hypothetical protein